MAEWSGERPGYNKLQEHAELRRKVITTFGFSRSDSEMYET